MAYTKQTWTNDVSKVNATRMTHIEDGIYDNSTDVTTMKSALDLSGNATKSNTDLIAGQITDVIGIKDIKYKGQTSQITTTGKNLMPQTLASTGTTNGISWVVNEDGTIKINGTATADVSISVVSHLTFETGNYIISGCPSGGASTSYSMVLAATARDTGSGKTFTSASNKEVLIEVKNGTVCKNLLFKPQIETGSTATTYEKYTGKIAGPNPDYPQEVQVVKGSNKIIINNNLWAVKDGTYTHNGITAVASGGTITLNGTSTSSTSIVHIPLLSDVTWVNGQSYTISANNDTATTKVKLMMYSDATSDMTLNPINRTAVINYTTSANIYTDEIAIRTDASTTITNLKLTPVLEQGTSAITGDNKGGVYDLDLPVENLWGGFADFSSTSSNINFVSKTDGTIIANGKSNAANSTSCSIAQSTSNDVYKILPAGTYTFRCEQATTNYKVQLYDVDTSTQLVQLTSSTATTFTLSAQTKVLARVTIATSGSIVSTIFKIQLERGDKLNAYTPYGTTPIELCKIGNYQDSIYRKDGKWFVYKEYEKVYLKDLTWSLSNNTGISNTNTNRWACSHACSRITNNSFEVSMSNILPKGTAATAWTQDVLIIAQSASQLIIRMPVSYTTASDLVTALENMNAVGYLLLSTPTEEEITYEPLIRQLETIYNAGMFDITNISQENADKEFLLDIVSCCENYNGIIEYIRR